MLKGFFGGLLYSETWEDFSCEQQLLSPRSRVLCITSGGSVPLNSCLSTKHVKAIDENPVQTHVFEFKRAALALDYDRFWDSLTSGMSQEEYRMIRHSLPALTQNYFDKHKTMISRGILNRGVLMFGLALLRKYLRVTVGGRRIQKLMAAQSVAEQSAEYAKVEPIIWNALSRNIPSLTMAAYAIPSAQLRTGECRTIAPLFRDRMREVFDSTLIRKNFYWNYIMTGEFDNKYAPLYLQEKHYSRLQRRASDIDANTVTLARVNPGAQTHIFLSDTMDWMTDAQRNSTTKRLLQCTSPGGVWTLRTLAPKPFLLPGLSLQSRTGKWSKLEMTASYRFTCLYKRTD